MVDLNKLLSEREQIRKNNKTIILTNGCFDILHKGHISYLKEAKKYADYLWILLNSDNSIRILKGQNRPINNQNDRMFILQNIKPVDKVIIFNEINCAFWIDFIKPDFYCKASDYNINNIDQDEYKAIKDNNINVKFLNFIKGYSSTKIINKLKTKTY